MEGSTQTLTFRKTSRRPKDHINAITLNNSGNSNMEANDPFTAVPPIHHQQQQQQQSWAGPFDWSRHQYDIIQLYKIEKRPLKNVRQIMWDKYHFHATDKMYKDHFKQWGIRKNKNRSLQQRSPTAAHNSTVGGDVAQRNLSNQTGGIYPRVLYPTALPQQFGSPGVLNHAELSMHMIREYITRMDIAYSSNPASSALGPASYNAAAGKTYHWMTLIGIARSFILQDRNELGFALLNECFAMFREMLDPSPWLILATFYGAFDLARCRPELANSFMRQIDRLTKANARPNAPQHAFHDLFAILRKSGPDGVMNNFEAVIMGYFMDLMASSFLDKKVVLEIMRSFSRSFIKAAPSAVYAIEAPRSTVQQAFDHLEGKEDSLRIRPMNPTSELRAIVNFPRSPMDDFHHGWVNTHPPSPPTPATSPEATAATTPAPLGSSSSSAVTTPAAFNPHMAEIIMNKVIEESPVEMHADNNFNFSVTARLMDLKKCFNPSAHYSDIAELRPAYEGLQAFYYGKDITVYLG